jgi:hypothetical protein
VSESSKSDVLGVGVLALYLSTFWKLYKSHPGNKVVRCGVISLTVYAALLILIRFPSIPQRVIDDLGLLLFLLCLLTMFFVFQRLYGAVRSGLRKSKNGPPAADN